MTSEFWHRPTTYCFEFLPQRLLLCCGREFCGCCVDVLAGGEEATRESNSNWIYKSELFLCTYPVATVRCYCVTGVNSAPS